MKLYNISLQSIRRKKAKTFFLLTGLMLSVSSVVMLFIVSKNVNSNVASLLDEFGANIIITPKSDELSFNYAGISVNSTTYELYELKNDDIDKIRTIKNSKNISLIAPKLFVLEEINDKKIIIAGIDMKEELRLKKWWKIYGKIPSSDNEILFGSKAMEKLSVRLKDTIQVANHNFIIAGILEETGSQDDAVIFMPIKIVQQIFNKKDKISLIEVAALCYDCPIEEIVRQTSKVLPNANVTPIKQTIESKMTAVHRFEHFSFGISAVILIISMLIVFTNVNASVSERTKEIGIFQAVGFRRTHIMKIILLEVLIVSLFAGLLGFILGIIGSKFIVPLLTMDDIIKINYEFGLIFFSVGFSLLVGLLAGIYPAFRATQLDPTTAFRAL